MKGIEERAIEDSDNKKVLDYRKLAMEINERAKELIKQQLTVIQSHMKHIELKLAHCYDVCAAQSLETDLYRYE